MKERPPREFPMEEEVVVHVVLEHGVNIEYQVNSDPMEEDDDSNNII